MTMPSKPKRHWTPGGVLLLLAAAVLAAAVLIYTQSRQIPVPAATPTPAPTATAAPPPTPTPAEQDPAMTEAPAAETVDTGLTPGKWYVTPERKTYVDGSLRLVIPKLNVDVPVLNGVDSATLLKGVGLYDYAQLPGEGDRNVSIAGHRNGLKNGKITDNMPFYYLDTLETGDYLYLSDSEHIYRYRFTEQSVVEPDDWGPIAVTEGSTLTLTTCTPIGVSDHRLIVRGTLDAALPAGDTGGWPEKEI